MKRVLNTNNESITSEDGDFMNRRIILFIVLSIVIFVVDCTSEQVADSKTALPNFVRESDFETIDWARKAVEFGDSGMIGNENKSGVIGANMPSLNGQKWMWHLWGIEHTKNKKLTIVGFHKESETVHQILLDGWTTGLGGTNNGADAHTPSTVKIPQAGEWALLLYTDEKLFDILVFDIKE